MRRYHFADCELDPAARSLLRAGAAAPIEPKVFDLLVYLIEQRGRCIGREELLDAIWPGTAVAPASLSRAIKEARRAVGDDGERQAIIATLHGRGYRFVAELSAHSAGGASMGGTAPALRGGAMSVSPAGRELAAAPRTDAPTERRVYSSADDARAALPAIVWVFPHFGGLGRLPERGALSLGRSRECGMALAGNDLSRRHAEIVRDGPIYLLRDLASTNGTFLNGMRIEQAPLTFGDVVRLGDVIGVVTRAAADDDGRPRELAPGVIGSIVLERALRSLREAAREHGPLVIAGESGVGKQLGARAIHVWSGRHGGFAMVDCAELDDAAAGALFDGPGPSGVLRDARAGTLLLRDLPSLPAAAQGRLSRAIERGVLAGANGGPGSSDVRLIVTAQQPLADAVDEGRLSAELHARIAAMSVWVPPLRARIEDVPALFAHFVRLHGGDQAPTASVGLIERLCLHAWSDNVAELETLAKRLLAEQAYEPILRSAHLPAEMRA